MRRCFNTEVEHRIACGEWDMALSGNSSTAVELFNARLQDVIRIIFVKRSNSTNATLTCSSTDKSQAELPNHQEHEITWSVICRCLHTVVCVWALYLNQLFSSVTNRPTEACRSSSASVHTPWWSTNSSLLGTNSVAWLALVLLRILDRSLARRWIEEPQSR